MRRREEIRVEARDVRVGLARRAMALRTLRASVHWDDEVGEQAVCVAAMADAGREAADCQALLRQHEIVLRGGAATARALASLWLVTAADEAAETWYELGLRLGTEFRGGRG